MHNAEAKYQAIFETLRNEILLGKFDARTRFPSEGQLTRRFGVSRPTVTRALLELKRAGLLEGRPGSGTYLTSAARNATGSLGLIIPGHGSAEIFPPICAEIARASRDEGYTILFGDASSRDPATRVAQAIRLARDYTAQHVAGIFLEPIELAPGAAEATRTILDLFDARHVPVVLLDRDILAPPARSAYDLVGIDNVQAGYRLARHLIDQGARRLAFVRRPGSAPTVQLREQGIAAAVTDARLPWSHTHAHAIEPDDARAVAALLRRKPRPDAVICANDVTAACFARTCATLGLHIPQDLLLAGFDGQQLSAFASPPLTTMRQPCELIARTAVQTLLQRIRRRDLPPRQILLDAELVPRRSSQGRAGARPSRFDG